MGYYLDVDTLAGQTTMCGAGEFAGVVEDSVAAEKSMHFAFESRDPDENCFRVDGALLIFDAVLSADRTQLSGTYLVGDEPAGIFSTTLQN